MANLVGQTVEKDTAGVLGDSTKFEGVRGISHAPSHGGVVGINDNKTNIAGPGVFGKSKGTGIWGDSETWHGVYGESCSTTGGAGVWGEHKSGGTGTVGISNTGVGVWGISESGEGMHAETKSLTTAAVAAYNLNENATGAAVYAKCRNSEGIHAETESSFTAAVAAYNLNDEATGAAVYAKSRNSEAIHAETDSKSTAAVAAYQMNADSGSAAFFAKHHGNRTAGRFEGDLEVTGDIRLMNADCAEDFNIAEGQTVEPGTVMVLCDEGTLKPGKNAYDKRVAGVISGAGNYKPGIILDTQPEQGNRAPVALLGKVFCKVDASYSAIEVGDLLTSSDNPGYAMKATDPMKAFGSIIGKALRPLKEGQGLIPILVTLQ